jgi:hypothetical protein
MMRRARWWHEAGGLALCPTATQLEATLQPWRGEQLWAWTSPSSTSSPPTNLLWLGLPLPTPVLVIALERQANPVTTRWIAQLLLSEPDELRACERRTPSLAPVISEVRAMASPAGLPTFLHRSAQVPLADLGWFADHEVTAAYPERAWPPADDHFPAALHGHRAVRALRGLHTWGQTDRRPAIPESSP